MLRNRMYEASDPSLDFTLEDDISSIVSTIGKCEREMAKSKKYLGGKIDAEQANEEVLGLLGHLRIATKTLSSLSDSLRYKQGKPQGSRLRESSDSDPKEIVVRKMANQIAMGGYSGTFVVRADRKNPGTDVVYNKVVDKAYASLSVQDDLESVRVIVDPENRADSKWDKGTQVWGSRKDHGVMSIPDAVALIQKTISSLSGKNWKR